MIPLGRRVILTGASGCGKTRACQAVAESVRGRGRQVAGVVSPGVWAEGEKVAIDALDLRSGETRRLAERKRADPAAAGPATPGWAFHAETVTWCNSLLAGVGGTDLLVIDELGPLEWEQGQGLTSGLRAMDTGRFRMGLTVVRPRLLELAQRRWPDARVVRINGLQAVPACVAEILSLADTADAPAPRGG